MVKFVIAVNVAAKEANAPDVQLEMKLRNDSSKEVFVNVRFAVAPIIGDVQPEVTVEGRAVPFRFRVRLPDLGSKEFVRLAPGEAATGTYLLSRGYDVSKAGTYVVQAKYVNKFVPPELQDHGVFVGEVASNAVTFDVPRR